MPLSISAVPKRANKSGQLRAAECLRAEKTGRAKEADSSEAAHIRAAHALSYLFTVSVIRAVAIAVYPLYR